MRSIPASGLLSFCRLKKPPHFSEFQDSGYQQLIISIHLDDLFISKAVSFWGSKNILNGWFAI